MFTCISQVRREKLNAVAIPLCFSKLNDGQKYLNIKYRKAILDFLYLQKWCLNPLSHSFFSHLHFI